MDFKGLVNKVILGDREVLSEQLAYWKRRLEGAAMVLDLPTDHPRSPSASFVVARQTVQLSHSLSLALQRLSRQEGVSLFVTLLAAWQTLLHRYTSQDDLLVGTPVAAGSQAEPIGRTGRLDNLLALRTTLSGNPSFRELLTRVRQVVVEAQEHQEVLFEQLVQALKPRLDPSRHPLFQVMFALVSAGQQAWGVNSGMTGCDLALCIEEMRQELRGWVEYNSSLFDEATIVRLVGHWQMLLEGIVVDPGQRLSELPLLTEAERHQQQVEWNATQADYPADQCIHQLFEAQVQRAPEAVAVVFEHEQLTYRELNQRANQLAHHLQRLGVGPEMLVALCVERSLEMVVGILGILKAGGAYVPLDPAYPRERLAFMLQDTQAPVLVTQERLREGLPRHEAQVVCLDSDWETIALESTANPISEVTADNLVYVIYTSGSTGKPKGIMVTHRNLVNSTCARMTYYRIPVTGFLLLSSFAFDSSVAGIFWTLCQGGMLVLPQQGFEQDPSQLAEAIARNRVSHLLSIPSLYSLLLTQVKPEQLETLQVVIVAGESCPRELPQGHRALLSHVALFNEYGPTEGTVWSSVYEIGFQEQSATVPIGRPIANTQIYILDRAMQPVPIGVTGELYIGGVNVARGYFHRLELTAEKFIQDPFNPEPGMHLFKTGDLARYLPTGDIEFLGRLDHQVKLRGFRIEAGEIEAALSQHPAVQACMVVAREDVPGNRHLVAYIVPRREQIPKDSELRRSLQERLPDYMIPSAFELLESLPYTPNGKVDRRRLPAPEETRREMEETLIDARLPVHQQLRQIWEDLLEVRPIGIRDNFFELGGHSLLAARLVNRIEQVWGKKISLTTLLAGATIEQLAQALAAPEESSSESTHVAVQADSSQLRGDGHQQDTFTRKPILNPEELLYRLVVVPLVAFLPAPLAYGLALRRGDWRYRHDTATRERLMRNLEGVLGEQLSPAERARVTRDFFRRRSCEAVDGMRLAGMGRALARLIEVHGLEHIEAALAAGKGAIICSAHFGFFTGGFSLIGAYGFPVTNVGDRRATEDPSMSAVKRFLWWLIYEKRAARHQRRPTIEPLKEPFSTAIRMTEILRSNELITIALDAPVAPKDRARAVPVDFLGRQVLLLPGSVSIAQLTDSPVLILVVRRLVDWRHQVLEISPPVPLDGDTVAAFKRCMAMVEVPIRQNLAYWDYWGGDTQNLIKLGLLPAQESH